MGGLWPLVTRSLRARPLRAVLTAIAVGLGVAAVLGVQVAEASLDTQASDAQAQRAGRSGLDVRVVAGRGLTSAELTALTRIDGVRELQPLYEKRVAAHPLGDEVATVTVTVVGASADGEAAFRPVTLRRGRLPHAQSTDEVTLDEGVATNLAQLGNRGVDVGSVVELTTSTGPDRFTVVGISAGTSAGAAFTRSAAFVSLEAARGPFALGLHTPLVAVRLDAGADSQVVARAARAALGPVVATVDPRGTGVEPLHQLRPLLLLVTVLSVVIGAGVTANTVAVSALERRRDIGLLRAAGASRRQVLRLFLGEAIAIAIAGAVAGILAGIVLGLLLVHRFAPDDLGVPALHVGVAAVAGALAAGIGAALVGAVAPAFIAHRLRPLDALRSSPAGHRERTPRALLVALPLTAAVAAVGIAVGRAETVALGVAALLLATTLTLPALVPPFAWLFGRIASPRGGQARVAAANLVRRRNRTSLTVAGLAVSVATATALGALTGGALDAGDRWIAHLFVGDQVLVSPATAVDAVADDIATRQSVTVSRIRYLSAPVAGAVTGFAAIDVAPYIDHSALDMVDGDRSSALRDIALGPAVLVPQSLADSLGWHRGASLSVDTGSGSTALTVAGVVAHSFPAGDGRESLLIGHDEAQQLFGAQAAGFDALQVVNAGSASQQRVAAAATAYGLQVTSVDDIRAAAQRSISHSIELLSSLSWLAILVAMLAVVNTVLVNVQHGRRELALLRAVGMSSRVARRLVITEAALLALIGAVLGVALGCVIALPLLHASASSGFDPQFVFPFGAAIAAAAAVIAGSVIAAAYPARVAARASIVSALPRE